VRRSLALAEEQPERLRRVTHFFLNLGLTALLVSAAVELGKRSPAAGALLISLPLSSLIGLSLLYSQTKDTAKVAAMSVGIFWAILPSLVLLALLPFLLRRGWAYWPALGASCAVMACGYAAYAATLRRLGVAL
jgi:hypothetical protein